jgi:hypothetical protein
MRTGIAMVALALAAATAVTAQEAPPPPPPIEDNSFLIEEAYNQERGIVQHINTLLRVRQGSFWAYGFTQEWPLLGQRHQLSYTVALQPGVDELAINYRMQVAGIGGEGPALAPRVSLLLPLGDEGGTGMQLNLPASVAVGERLVTHWNAGATLARRTPSVYHAGASAILLLRPTVNLMVEVAWEGTGRAGEDDVIVNPGIRWAHNLGSLQIVPGIAWPDARDVFFYLSLEHPFR